MGCASSKNDAVAETEPKNEDEKKPEVEEKKEEAPGGEKPKPQIFAIMRNGHEVVRGAQRDIGELIQKGDISGAKEMWERLHKWADIHMKMEEGTGTDESPIGVFKLLDKNYENVAKEQGLYDDHIELTKKEKELDAAFEDADAETVKAAFDAFAEANSAHLKKEEDIMMPKIQQFVKNGHPMKKYMQDEILALVEDDQMEFFIKFANEVLEKHPEGQPRVRVFDHALFAAAKPDQWPEWEKWIKETISEKSFQELQDVIKA